MLNARSLVPDTHNESVKMYAPGSTEREELRATYEELVSQEKELPLIIDNREVRTGNTLEVRPPHNRERLVGTLHQGGAGEVNAAIDAARRAKHDWAMASFEERAGVLLRAAEMLAGRYRARINAATMVCQSKTPHQAEIDAACELIDFLRFNVKYAAEIMAEQPYSPTGLWNRLDWRPLDGFVLAVTPFNFMAIAGNLPTAPALMGNTVVWKPATSQALAATHFMEILLEAGLPPGVINLCHAPGRVIGETALEHPELAGVHFTGSTGTFQHMWRTIGEKIAGYRQYPRLVGETGGKDFIFAHASCDVQALVAATVRGAFEYQGQKCSAASRAYIPKSIWKEFRERLEAEVGQIRMGDVGDFGNFMGAVIDANAYRDITGYIDFAKNNAGGDIWLGGGYNDDRGFFIEPTVVVAEDPRFKLMQEEIFGPVLTLYCYDDAEFEETLALCDQTSPYALTGAVFARDTAAVRTAMDALRHAAGNFYVNDKPTGAVVNQQPFGGSRASGTNDKAGSKLNLLRWTSPRTVKETLDPPRDWRYPYMQPDQ
jgi:1-pyrroline-5-carboxylate dehydrogenase